MASLRVTAFTVAALLFWAGAPRAAECEKDPQACGRDEFDAGIKAYEAGDYKVAAEHFSAAYGYRKHPVLLFNWALAESRLGQYVEAVAHFDQVAADPETPKELAPKVAAEKAQAERGLATLEVEAQADASVTVDEKPATGQPAVVKVNPGEHKVVVSSGGRTVLERSVRVASGERLRLAVDRPREVKPPPPPPPKPKPVPVYGPSPLWFWAGAGVTAVLGGVTTWSALDTKRAYDDYKRDLPTLDQSAADQRVSDGHAKELRTNVLIGATAVAAAGTAVLGLFVVDWHRGRNAPTTGFALTPTGVSAFGRF